MALDQRKQLILHAIVEDYVMTALPVGSRTICGKYMSGLSSATIRNEMSDLEQLGYLEQPHVSAGRVPNARAYRHYVDSLPRQASLSAREARQIQEKMAEKLKRLDDMVAGTADLLSELSGYTALALMPKQEDLRITRLHLIPVSHATALVVVVTDGGIMRDAWVQVAEALDDDGLYAISRMLSDRLHMRTLGEAQQLLRGFALNAPWDPQVLEGIAQLAAQLQKQSASDRLKVSGAHQMLNYPEYSEVDKARSVLSALNEKESLLELMREGAQQPLSVSIGPESGIRQMQDLSLVMASYELGRGHRGAIGLIGPTRMPYGRMLSMLSLVSHTLSRMLSGENND